MAKNVPLKAGFSNAAEAKIPGKQQCGLPVHRINLLFNRLENEFCQALERQGFGLGYQ